MSAREWIARLRDRFRRDALDRELQEELRFHRESLARDGAAGRLGNESRIRESARDRWSFAWLDALEQDARLAVRGLRRSPGFTITVVLTLGLGIGANATMFGVIDRLMFRPHAYLRDPARVHRVYLMSDDRGQVRYLTGSEYTRYLDLSRWTTSFDRMAAISEGDMAVGEGSESREVRVARISATLFDFFDAPPVLGRFFTAAEDSTPRGASVVVLGYGYWQSAFGGRNVVGRPLVVGNIRATIIGVAPRGFGGFGERGSPALFLPLTTYAAASPNSAADVTAYYTRYQWGFISMLARRKPGVTVEQASADLTRAFARSWDNEAAVETGVTPAAMAHPRAVAGPVRTPAGPGAPLESQTLLWVGGVAVVVLLIACANVANLLFARTLRRRRETAVRLALGVSRSRLISQTLVESAMLAALGCGAGVLIAQWGGAALRRLLFVADDPGVLTDGRTLAVAAAVAVAVSVLTGLWPALQSGSGDLTGDLKAGVREGGPRRSRMRSALLVLQTALSVVLLVGATLFVRSLDHVRSVRMGYDVESLVLAAANTRGERLDTTGVIQLRARMLEAALSVPGVSHAATMSSIPFRSTSNTNLVIPGIDSVRRLGRFTYQAASADYFATTGTRILAGRAFGAEDGPGAPLVGVVSASMARVLWPGRNAIGQCMHVGGDTVPCTTVIGVAEDAMQNSVVDDPKLRYYLPNAQSRYRAGQYLMLRLASGRPEERVEDIRATIQRVMPGGSYVNVMPFARVIGDQRRPWQLGATMFAAFGVLALVVAAVGQYGVLAYAVAQRMHELGVRVALGARRRNILVLVMRQGFMYVVAGIVLGTAAAFWLGRFVQPLLYQQQANDPEVFGLVALTLAGAGMLATLVPARRATSADPNAALRAD